jgi:hypothetical protein
LLCALCVWVCTSSPSDATKTAPGACGCGVADTDADGDLTPDCNDGWYEGCRVGPGMCVMAVLWCLIVWLVVRRWLMCLCICACGCARSPADAFKTAAGACGCGVADTDTDGDLTPDCTDGWYEGVQGVARGVYDGCAVVVDSVAGGGEMAQVGLCTCVCCRTTSPADAAKIAAGVCGCGVADTDADGDLTPDCNDGWYEGCRTGPAVYVRDSCAVVASMTE